MIDFFIGEAIWLSPWFLGVLLFLGAFILEDAAIVSGAMVAADNMIHPGVAFTVLLAGIVCGDFILYWVGLLIGQRRSMKRWRELKTVLSVEKWLTANLFMTVFLVRFLPGLRLPCYLASGWLGLPPGKFVAAVLIAGMIWTSLVFSSLLWMGAPIWQKSGLQLWMLLPVFLSLVYLVQRLFRGKVQRYLEKKIDR